MNRPHLAASGHLPATALFTLALVASVAGCRGEPPIGPGDVRRVAIVLVSDTLRPGKQLQASAYALNGSGEIVDAEFVWRSLTPSTLVVGSDGALTALAPGVGVVRVSVGGVSDDHTIQLVNPGAASLVTDNDSVTLMLPGGALQLAVTPLDAEGDPIVGANVQWSSDAARIATVTIGGSVAPVAVGRAVIHASVDGVQLEIPVRVGPAPIDDAPELTSLSPSVIGPGTPFTVRGRRFASAMNATTVQVDGRPAQILSISDTLITAILSAGSLPCEPSANVAVQVRTPIGVGAIAARQELAAQREPLLGEAVLLSAGEAGCVELPGDGRYLVSVLNVSRALGAGDLSLTLDALSGLGAPLPLLAPNFATAPSSESEAHLQLLRASARAARAARTLPTRQAPRPTIASVNVAPVGGLTALRIPDLNASNICGSFRAVQARTVYEGVHVSIVEDTSTQLNGATVLAGAMDASIEALGLEIDNVIWPIIERFGNPLVMDSRLDDNNRVVVVLTPALNAMRNGEILGAVVTCDFYQRSQLAASNVGEVLYLQMPTVTAAGSAAASIATWRHAVRGTVAHELKHIVSYAERIVRSQPLEEEWLEEATARHAEELFTRALTGATATGNTGFATLRCELLELSEDPGCAGTPALMRPTLDGMWDHLSNTATRSPLGAVSASDFSFYGSGWSLLRWAMDHAGTDEASFTSQLTLSGQSGVANLEARAGRSWEQMLARWSLALATDDRAGLTPTDAQLRLPSWNLANVFAGICEALGTCALENASRYSRTHPLQPLALPADFSLGIPTLVPAGFLVVEVAAGSPSTRRLLRLSGANGAPLPNTARLAVLRIP